MKLRHTELAERTLRDAYAMFPTGVTAVCAEIDSVPVGLAASSFVSVSIEPPLVSICIARTSTTWPRLKQADIVGVSVLGSDHSEAVRALARKSGDRFLNIVWERSDSGAIFVHGSSLWLECSIDEEVPAGDHHIVLLRVRALETYPAVAPIVFHSSAFAQLRMTAPYRAY
jgi:flavin reductase (DIM6/NTAB) family NADH-FMN oxidoreductase RutF